MNEMEAATRLFGWLEVRQALDNRKAATSYSLSNALLVATASHELRAKLRMSEQDAIAYCLSLPKDLKQCLICSLVRNISSEVIESLGFIETVLQDY
ncbi:hypothetical protein TUMEXPCC7403_25285 [Tumidithrix helvetica PCC 7403]|uniref:hypothetical protein n=1 Tax=Tumidithrix helvetica TaxID=3457545 RepID=UPI003C8AF25F